MRGDELVFDASVPRHIRQSIEKSIDENQTLFSHTLETLKKCSVEIHNLLGSTELYYVKHAAHLGAANDNPLLITYEQLLAVDSSLEKAHHVFGHTDHSLSLHHRAIRRLEKHLVDEHADRILLSHFLHKMIRDFRSSVHDNVLQKRYSHTCNRIRNRYLRSSSFTDWTHAGMHELPSTLADAQNILAFNEHRLSEIERLHTQIKAVLVDDDNPSSDLLDYIMKFLPYHFTLKQEKTLQEIQASFVTAIDEFFAHYNKFLAHHKRILQHVPRGRVPIDEEFQIETKLHRYYTKKEFIDAIMYLVKSHTKDKTFVNEKTFLRHLDILQNNYQYELQKVLHVGTTVLEQLARVHTTLQEFNHDVLDVSYDSYRNSLERLKVLRRISIKEMSIYSLGSLQGLVHEGLVTLEKLREREIEIFEEILEVERVLEHLYAEKHVHVLHDSFLESFLHKVVH